VRVRITAGMAVLVLSLFLFSIPSQADGGFRVWVGGGYGGFGVGFAGGHVRGHYARPYYPYRPYYPNYAPYYAPGWGVPGPLVYGARYVYVPAARPSNKLGKIQLDGADRMDRVYLDGGYAGIAGDLKTITIKPGTYNLEIKRGGIGVFSQRVAVLEGKTLKLNISVTP
jgi:hypothetical protein